MAARKGEATRLIKVGAGPESAGEPWTVAVNPPVQRGSTVILPDAQALYAASLTYGRQGLATQQALQAGLCALEHAHAAFLFPSGAAAVAASLLAIVSAGDEVLVVDCNYGPTRRLCDKTLARFGVTTRYFPPRISPEDLMAMAGPNCRAILLESPGSLTFEVSDTPAIAKAARERGVVTMIDNTWAAGLLFRPLDHGVDISIQALTKYVAGHADVFMGSVAVRDARLAAVIEAQVHELGWAVSPDDAYQVLRGLRTLPVRLARHGESGLAIARWLEQRPEVARVLNPALPSSPDFPRWSRDFTGACGLFGVVLQPCSMAAVHAFLNRLKLFGLGFSWGGFESLAIHCDPQMKRTAEPWNGEGPLIRLHVGLEDPADLIDDLQLALSALHS